MTSSGVQGAQRGAISWPNVQGTAQAGAWNGCAIILAVQLHGCVFMLAPSLFGAEIQHPGVEKDVTVLWCKSVAERDVLSTSARCMLFCYNTAIVFQDVMDAINSMCKLK